MNQSSYSRANKRVTLSLIKILKRALSKGLYRSLTAQSDVRWGYLTDGGSERRLAASLRCFPPKSERVVFQEGNFAPFNGIQARLIHFFSKLTAPVQPH